MLILAIDPGPTESGYVAWDGARVHLCGTGIPTAALFSAVLPAALRLPRDERGITLAVERVACYGAPVGEAVLETVYLSGRLDEWWRQTTGQSAVRATYGQVALALVQSRGAKESQVRQHLIDRFGAPGTRKAPGVLYGVHGHAWSALALAVCVADRQDQAASAARKEGVA